MYRHYMGWLREVSSEIELDQKFKKLLNRKRDLKVELCYLQREEAIAYNIYSKLKLAYARARLEYHETDFQLATIDGRLSVYEEMIEEEKRNGNVKTILDQLSNSDRAVLLAELEGMED